MGVCSIHLHIFSNSWCSFGGGVNDEGIFTREMAWKFEFLKCYVFVKTDINHIHDQIYFVVVSA